MGLSSPLGLGLCLHGVQSNLQAHGLWRRSDLTARTPTLRKPIESFDQGGSALVAHLRGFGELTKDWPEFRDGGFPECSIDRAIQFLGDVWLRTGSRGRATLVTAFCGPSEDGAVNCQWKRPQRFLGLTIPVEGPLDAYLRDTPTGEEFEGSADVETFAHWIERF